MIKTIKLSIISTIIVLAISSLVCYHNANAFGATLEDLTVRDIMASVVLGNMRPSTGLTPELIKRAYKEADMVMEYRRNKK